MELTAQSNDADAGGKKVYSVPPIIAGPGFIIEVKERDGDQKPVKAVEFNYSVDGEKGNDKTDDDGNLHTKKTATKEVDIALDSLAGTSDQYTMIIVANGFDAYNNNEAAEIADKHNNRWTPNTIDFQQTADDTKSTAGTEKVIIFGANDKSHFFGAIGQGKLPKPTDKIKRVAFIGHGSKKGLGFSGNRGQFWEFTEELVKDDFLPNQPYIDTYIKPRLTDDAKIDLYSCNSASDLAFMNAMAHSFNRQIRGFAEAISYCVKESNDHNHIALRGKLAKSSVPNKDPNCGSGWNTGVMNFIPDVPANP